MPIALFVAFLGWILYRLFIKKDLKQNLSSLYLGLFFTAIWIVLYYIMIKF